VDRSLTVLLPVRNAQTTLAANVQEILEVVSELTRRFELLIIDDGSTDATIEVADELIRCYPQIRTLRHGTPQGRDAAIGAGLRHSTGEVIVLRDEHGELGAAEIRRAWQAADENAVSLTANSDARRLRWQPPHEDRRGGYRMLDRRTLEQMQGWSRPARPNYLARLRDLVLDE
jgi:glycosyltransferase involved in cell wall biosynthesis